MQTCASRYSCAFCLSCKVDLEGKITNRTGTYQKAEMRTWEHIGDQNEIWLEETGGDRSQLKNYYNYEFKPIPIKSGKGSEPVMKTFPPDWKEQNHDYKEKEPKLSTCQSKLASL